MTDTEDNFNPNSIRFRDFLDSLETEAERWRRRRSAVDTIRVAIECDVGYSPLRD